MPSLSPVATSTSSPSLILKAGPGVLHAFSITTSDATGYVMVFDSATVPADGTVTPKYAYAIVAGSEAFNLEPNPARFANGIAIVMSTTGPFTKTLSSGTVHIVGQAE